MNLSGATVLVTGGARRVGRAIALELARCGCDVALHHYRSEREAEALAAEIGGIPRRCQLIHADLADPASWSAIVQHCVASLGSLDILINNASIYEAMALADFNLDDWDRTFRINVTAVIALCHHAAPHLAKNGRGRIVNIADIAADRPWPSHLAYCASKAALANLTKSLAKALAPDVQVNAVAPGIAIFPEYYDEEIKARLVAKVPLQRPGTPEDIVYNHVVVSGSFSLVHNQVGIAA